MSKRKDRIVRLIELDARARVAALANSYPHAQPEQREEIMAGIEFERWLADTCAFCLEKD
jgi:hypothetical protein